MKQQISKLSTLLNQVLRREQSRLALEFSCGNSNQFTQYESRVIKTEGLIEVAGEQVIFEDAFHSCLSFDLWFSKTRMVRNSWVALSSGKGTSGSVVGFGIEPQFYKFYHSHKERL